MNLDEVKIHLFSPKNQISPLEADKKLRRLETEIDKRLRSGVYAIFIKDPYGLPSPYSDKLIARSHNCIYIGKTYKGTPSLHRRLVRYDLQGRGPSTFFCSIGAVLGYRPPKGSLANKVDQNNFDFSREDKNKIRNWISDHLVVAWIKLPTTETKIEEPLIQNIRPLLNWTYNPAKLPELEALRNECREIARG